MIGQGRRGPTAEQQIAVIEADITELRREQRDCQLAAEAAVQAKVRDQERTYADDLDYERAVLMADVLGEQIDQQLAALAALIPTPRDGQ